MDDWHGLRDDSIVCRNIENIFRCFCGDHPLPESPPYSSKHGPGKDRNNILISGPTRSGSTVAWQILDIINDKKVLRSHGFNDSCPTVFRFDKVIVTVRNPFDAFYSYERCFKEAKPAEDFCKEYEDFNKFFMLGRLQKAINYRPDMEIIFLKYEDYWGQDTERILSLAKIIGKELSNRELNNVLSQTSIDKNLERSRLQEKAVQEGREIVRDRRIIADHVGSMRGAPGQGAFLDAETKATILERCSWIFEEFGYDKNGKV